MELCYPTEEAVTRTRRRQRLWTSESEERQRSWLHPHDDAPGPYSPDIGKASHAPDTARIPAACQSTTRTLRVSLTAHRVEPQDTHLGFPPTTTLTSLPSALGALAKRYRCSLSCS